ncbi:hypothetical protein AB1Y20_009087 [Prymnesium parvum]|uniref:Uncharacterized protein n=1 Tax=Prymnesium parvum TaxID=97485 RepID=A0AB34K3Y9_PRYPA
MGARRDKFFKQMFLLLGGSTVVSLGALIIGIQYGMIDRPQRVSTVNGPGWDRETRNIQVGETPRPGGSE